MKIIKCLFLIEIVKLASWSYIIIQFGISSQSYVFFIGNIDW